MSSTQSRGRQTVTAFFDSKAEAERAVERIKAEGVSSADIRLVAGDDTTATGTAPRKESKGFWDSLSDLFIPDEDRYTYAEGLNRGGYLVTVTTADVNHERVLDILDDEGTVDMDQREASWRSEGWAGYDASRAGSASSAYDEDLAVGSALGSGASGAYDASDNTFERANTTGGVDRTATGYASTSASLGATDASRKDRDGTIDVVEERLRVGKRDVSHGRVRVRSYVVEEPVNQDVNLRSETVEIERRPVDRALNAGENAFADRTLELEETGEEAVVSKEARVKEEIDLNRVASERTQTISDTVRRTEVEIEDERQGTAQGTTINKTGNVSR